MSDLYVIEQGDGAYWVPEPKGENPPEGTKRNGVLINPIYGDGRKQELKVSQTDFVWDGERLVNSSQIVGR